MPSRYNWRGIAYLSSKTAAGMSLSFLHACRVEAHLASLQHRAAGLAAAVAVPEVRASRYSSWLPWLRKERHVAASGRLSPWSRLANSSWGHGQDDILQHAAASSRAAGPLIGGSLVRIPNPHPLFPSVWRDPWLAATVVTTFQPVSSVLSQLRGLV